MKEIYIISPDFVRSQTNVSSNIQDKFLQSAIREAQDINYREIVGDKLLEHILELIESKDIDKPKNEIFKNLIKISKYYIAYMVIARLTIISGIKIDNMGPSRTSDDNIDPISVTDIFRMEKHYINIADTYCKKIQNYIKENYNKLAKYLINTCYSTNSNTYSAASTGIWLGGAKGKTYIKKYNKSL